MPPDPKSTEADALARGQARVRGLARSLVRDYDEAEDVVQEATLRALTGRSRPRTTVSAYLAGIVRNVAAKFHLSDRRRASREARGATAEAQPSTLELLERVDEQRRVLELVRALREPYRTAILLRFIEGLAPREIARQQELPVETVKSRIKRGLAMLRQALDDTHGGSRRDWLGAMLPIAGWPSLATASAVTATGEGGLMAATTTKHLAVVVALVVVLGGVALFATGLVGRADDEPGTRDVAGHAADGLAVTPGLEGGDPLATSAAEDSGTSSAPEAATSSNAGPGAPATHPDAGTGPEAGSLSHVPPVRRSAFAPPAPKGETVVNSWATAAASGGGMGPTGHWTRFPKGLPPQGRCSLAVKVVDEHGLPIEAAEVMILPADLAGHEGVSFGDVRKLGATAANGTYRHEQLTAGDVAVAANVGRIMNGRFGLDTRPAVRVTLRTGTTASAEVTLPLSVKDLGNVAGRITDSNGLPLRGATVAFESNQTRTGSDGGYKLLRVPAGAEQRIVVSRWGYETDAAEIEIRSGGTATHDVELAFNEDGTVTIRGAVVGPEGEPIQGAWVFLNVPGDRATHRDTRSDDAGRFEFVEIPERMTREAVEVQGAGWPRYGSTRVPFENGISSGTEVRIQIMERFVEFVFDVRDATTDQPVRRVRISAEPTDGDERRPGSFWYDLSKGGHAGALEPGRYHVVIEALDHDDTELDIDVASEDRVVHAIKLKRVAPDSVDVHFLVEVLATTTEAPIPNAKIAIQDADGRELGTFDGRREDGRYLLPAPSGKRVLVIEAEGFEPYREALDLDPQVLEVEHVVHLRPR